MFVHLVGEHALVTLDIAPQVGEGKGTESFRPRIQGQVCSVCYP